MKTKKLEAGALCGTMSTVAVRIVLVLSTAFMAFLCWNSMLYTGRMEPGGCEDITYTQDHVLRMLVLAAFGVAVILFLRRWLEKLDTRFTGRLVQLYFLVVSLVLVFGGRCNPVYDQQEVMNIAARWNAGDFSFLVEEYTQLYPHQLGLAGYEALQAALVGANNYLFFEMLNCFWLVAAVGALYRTVDLLFEEKGVTNTFLLFLMPCFPAIFYCTFTYGEISSLSLGILAVYCQMLYFKKEKWQYMVPASLCIMLAVLLRKNTLILLIAMVLVQLVYALGKKQVRTAALSLALVAAVAAGQVGIKAVCNANGSYQVPQGTPASVWVAMGMQHGDSLYGAYNGYTINLSRDMNYDHDLIAADAAQKISDSWSEMAADPGYMGEFYYHKLMQQWNEPSYNMFVMTHDTEGRPEWLQSYWSGARYGQMYSFLNYYQFLVYLFALVEMAFMLKKPDALKTTFALYFVGGFLFSLLWEAKARYMLAYYVLLVPLAGAGLYHAAKLAGQGVRLLREKYAAKAAPKAEAHS
ncbi:MAG: hypothetical protein LKJ90_05705 [Faecalibacterium sp.]|nr:hypothetical protein [Faecalibacterium sp.]